LGRKQLVVLALAAVFLFSTIGQASIFVPNVEAVEEDVDALLKKAGAQIAIKDYDGVI